MHRQIYRTERRWRIRMIRAYRAYLRCVSIMDCEKRHAEVMLDRHRNGLYYLRHQYQYES